VERELILHVRFRNPPEMFQHLRSHAKASKVNFVVISFGTNRFAIESGQLSWHGGIGSIDWHGQMVPKLSWHTWAALCEWAGRPSLPPQLKLIRDYPANGLAARANNCLSRAHIPVTKPAVILALTSGMLSREKGPNGYGKVTHAELCRWAGSFPRP